MYDFLRGALIEASPLCCVLDVHGVGYKLSIPANALSLLPPSGSEVMLYCSFIVREQSQALYGFLTKEERNIFEMLIGASGIGPKIALSMIGHLSVSELQQAIASQNSSVLCKIPGIGQKTAERLIVEMRDKFKVSSLPTGLMIAVPSAQQAVSDAMSALVHLGYTQATAQKAVQKTLKELPENSDLAAIITAALKNV